MTLPRTKWNELLEILELKVGRRYREIVVAVRESTAPLDKLASETKVKKLLMALSAS